MGFYSFYRIFKDIIRSIFGNKAWRYTLIVVLIVSVFTIFSVKVNGADLRPWNVYNNTTEFNWSRLTNLSFVDNNAHFTYKYYEIKPDEIYYLYNPNGSTGTLHYSTYVSSDLDYPIILIEETGPSKLHLDVEYSLNHGGYVDVPYNTIFTPQMTYYIVIMDSCELYLFDDKYSNIETYNEISATHDILKNVFGIDGEGIPTNFSTQSGLVASYLGNFISAPAFNTIYFKVQQGTTYSLSFSASSNVLDALRFGYCSSVPSVDGTIDSFTYWGDTNYSNPYTFTADRTSYFYVSYNKNNVSNLSLTSNENLLYNLTQQTNDTLTDSNISQNSSDYNLPSDSTNDITQDGFGSIFDRIRNTFTSGSSTPAVVNVPFTNKSFTISKASVFGSANLGIVQTLIEAFWWFIISLFIVKDIFKKIEKIKTGNIEFTETTNIKEDIL